MKVLVTGAAGFIGFHTINLLQELGYTVIGLDNINDYYSPALKYARLQELGIFSSQIKWNSLVKSCTFENVQFVRMNIDDKHQLFNLFNNEQFDLVINLAAQAGVRYSIENPDVYINSNIIGWYNILEACRKYPVKHLIHASSSSVYGNNQIVPFSEEDKTDHPVSLYAASKKSNELMGYTYSHLYEIPITCLRFFTVYGPWGRPDMAPMLFAKAIHQDLPISVFNNGIMKRDFTYVTDIVGAIAKVLKVSPVNTTKFRVLNIGNGAPVDLMDFIFEIEKAMGKSAIKDYKPMQAGDVSITWANNQKIQDLTNSKPKVGINEGVPLFINWFKDKYLTLSITDY